MVDEIIYTAKELISLMYQLDWFMIKKLYLIAFFNFGGIYKV